MEPNTGSTEPLMLDRFDRDLLALVQKDNQLTHAELGEQVGLSGSAVRRRLARLRKDGIIRRDVSLLDTGRLTVTLITDVEFGEESPEIYDRFEERMLAAQEVMQCYHVAGDRDFVLIVQVPSLEYYETWSRAMLMSDSAIRRYSTKVVWSCKKFETAIEV